MGPKATALDVLKAYWKAMRPYKWLFFLVLFWVSIASAIQVFIPIYYKRFFDTLTSATLREAATPALIRIVLIIFIINGIAWVSFRLATFIQNYFQARVIALLKQQALEYLLGHSYDFFSNNFTGSLVQRVNRFARSFDRLADRLVWTIVPLCITVSGVLIVLWRVNSIIAIIVMGWILGLFAFNYFFSLWKVKYDIERAELDSKSTGLLSDDITNHSTIQLFTGQVHEYEQYQGATNDQARAQMFAWNLSAIFEAFQAGFMIIAEFLLFYVSVRYWGLGVFSVGTFVLIQVYFLSLGGRLWNLSRIVRDVYEGFADAKEMVEIMLLPHGIRDLPVAKELAVKNGEVGFKNVTFSFNETREVLSNINLTIQGGEKVALIGPSGAGKSTFIRLLLRFYDVTAGAIMIDDQDIKHATLESLRANVSLVPQDPILFHRTLKDNIRYGRRDATDEEVFEAGRLAHCDEFVKNTPNGYDTYVGERGIKLSGGERQRVAIARAILKNAPILILDEATSSLDSESESLIQDALEKLMHAKTVIVIAHRLSTIRKMDRIIVLDGGKITEEGTHQDLLSKEESLYRKLWDLQAGGFLV